MIEVNGMALPANHPAVSWCEAEDAGNTPPAAPIGGAPFPWPAMKGDPHIILEAPFAGQVREALAEDRKQKAPLASSLSGLRRLNSLLASATDCHLRGVSAKAFVGTLARLAAVAQRTVEDDGLVPVDPHPAQRDAAGHVARLEAELCKAWDQNEKLQESNGELSADRDRLRLKVEARDAAVQSLCVLLAHAAGQLSAFQVCKALETTDTDWVELKALAVKEGVEQWRKCPEGQRRRKNAEQFREQMRTWADLQKAAIFGKAPPANGKAPAEGRHPQT